MLAFDENVLKQESFLLYIYTPLCATCNFARSILKRIEMTHEKDLFYQMNAAYYEDFMLKYKIKSIPCLFIQTKDHTKKIYAFHSVSYIYQQLMRYAPEHLVK